MNWNYVPFFVTLTLVLGYIAAIWRNNRQLVKARREAAEARRKYDELVARQGLIEDVCLTCKQPFSEAKPHYAGGVCRSCWATSH